MIAALRQGLRILLRNRRVMVVYYGCNLLFALLLVAPFAAQIGRFIGHSKESARLLANLDPQFITEYLNHFSFAQLGTFPPLFAVVAVLYLLLSIFLAGGAISTLQPDSRLGFFTGCALYFPRFLRLFLISQFFYGIVFGISAGGNFLLSKAAKASMVLRPVAIAGWVWSLCVLLLFGLVNMIFDYAKIACVLEGSRKMLRETVRSIRFVFRNFRATAGLYLLLSALGFLMLALYNGITELLGQATVAMVVIVLVLRQIYMLLRVCLRLTGFASESRLWAGIGIRYTTALSRVDHSGSASGSSFGVT